MTREIPLTRGYAAIVDEADYERVAAFKWYACKYGAHGPYAHRMIVSNGKRMALPMHRFILNAQPGLVVDHIDGNGLNNSRSNLRLCTQAENLRNQKVRINKRTSKFRGVSWKKDAKLWAASIQLGGKRQRVLYFKTEIEAARAYDKLAAEYHGEFARPNFQEGGGK